MGPARRLLGVNMLALNVALSKLRVRRSHDPHVRLLRAGGSDLCSWLQRKHTDDLLSPFSLLATWGLYLQTTAWAVCMLEKPFEASSSFTQRSTHSLRRLSRGRPPSTLLSDVGEDGSEEHPNLCLCFNAL